jgi:hypothetical protein
MQTCFWDGMLLPRQSQQPREYEAGSKSWNATRRAPEGLRARDYSGGVPLCLSFSDIGIISISALPPPPLEPTPRQRPRHCGHHRAHKSIGLSSYTSLRRISAAAPVTPPDLDHICGRHVLLVFTTAYSSWPTTTSPRSHPRGLHQRRPLAPRCHQAHHRQRRRACVKRSRSNHNSAPRPMQQVFPSSTRLPLWHLSTSMEALVTLSCAQVPQA